MRITSDATDPRWRWKILAPIMVICLSVTSWSGLSVGLAMVQILTVDVLTSKSPDFAPPSVIGVLSVAMFPLTGIAALHTWQHITRARRPGTSIGVPLPLIAIILSIIIVGSVMIMFVFTFKGEVHSAFVLTFLSLSCIIFLTGGLPVGFLISLIPHAEGYLSDFHMDYIMMTSAPVAGMLIAIIPFAVFLSLVGLIFIIIFLILFAIFCYVLKERILGFRHAFLQEIASLLLVRRGQNTSPVPQDYQEEPRPLTAAWKTLRRARPFAPMMSLILAAYMAASSLSFSVGYDIQVSVNGTGQCNSYGTVNVTLLLLCLPTCFVPLAVHVAYYRQREAKILHPICAAVVAIGPTVAQTYLGPHFLNCEKPSAAWTFIASFAILSCVRAAMVAAAYVDLLYEVFLANDCFAPSIPAGTGALAIISGSTGVALGALNTLLITALRQKSFEFMAATSAFPIVLVFGIIGTIVWRSCRPIAIEG